MTAAVAMPLMVWLGKQEASGACNSSLPLHEEDRKGELDLQNREHIKTLSHIYKSHEHCKLS